jgi:hypothetical protein
MNGSEIAQRGTAATKGRREKPQMKHGFSRMREKQEQLPASAKFAVVVCAGRKGVERLYFGNRYLAREAGN